MKKNYLTSDFYLTAFLLSKNYQFDSTQQSLGKLTFIIIPDERLDSLVSDFYASKALVNPLDYQNQLRNLKSLIYATKNENEHANKSNRANIQGK